MSICLSVATRRKVAWLRSGMQPSINDLIRNAGITGSIGLLSVDIDGNELYFRDFGRSMLESKRRVLRKKVKLGVVP